MKDKLLIGWGESDITPSNAKVELSGQYYQRLSKGIHSRIKAVALAITKGDEQAILVTLDVVGVPKALQDFIREAIHQAIPEIKKASIFLNAIHTHSAPYTRPAALFRNWLPLEKDALKPEEYYEFLKAQILDAVKHAWDCRKIGGIKSSFASARIGHCRRPVYADGTAEMYGSTKRPDFVGLEAGEDSGIELLFTYDEAKKITGAIVNASCPSQVMEATYKISSDFAGATRENLKKSFGNDFHMLYLVGASGCQSPRDLTRNYHTEPDCWHEDGVPFIAERLTQAVLEGYAKAPESIDFNPEFRRKSVDVTLPVRRVSYCQYKKAQAEVAELKKVMDEKTAFYDFCDEIHAHEKIAGRPGPYDDKEHHFVQIQNRKAIIERYKSQDKNPDYSFEMNVMRLGENGFASCPFELYLVFGQIIKARTVCKQVFFSQLTGDVCGYLPSPLAEQVGGYGGMIINGSVGSDGGFKLADIAVEEINNLFN